MSVSYMHIYVDIYIVRVRAYNIMESYHVLMKFDILLYVWGPNSVNLIVQFQCTQFIGC